jgi:sialidase-1
VTRLLIALALLMPAPLFGAGPTFIDVFTPKADGYKSVRIPALVVTKAGTLLAFAEGRAANTDQAKNKLLLKRSTDGGKSWGQLAVIADGGDRPLNNPCAVVDRKTGRVLLMFQSYPAGIAERSPKLKTGHAGDAIVRNFLITSDDDGKTWAKPRDVTAGTKRPTGATTNACGPGVGIQLTDGPHAGRILIPFNEGPWGQWNVYAAISDDGGATWATGKNAPGGTDPDGKPGEPSTVNEVQFVELAGGLVRLNARRWSGRALRKTAVSTDGGVTWSAVEDVPELADPGCMASMVRVSHAPSRILFSGPISTKRANGTVFLSTDEGKTWPTHRVLVAGPFAYSCLAGLPDGTVGCLYEADNYGAIRFARFTLDWLMAGDAKPK